jgi:hypothetical protein
MDLEEMDWCKYYGFTNPKLMRGKLRRRIENAVVLSFLTHTQRERVCVY